MASYVPNVVMHVDAGSCGTGSLSLTAYKGLSFATAMAAFGITGEIVYNIKCFNSSAWEIGTGTISGNVLTRVSVIASTNGNNLIDVDCDPCGECPCIVTSEVLPVEAVSTTKGTVEPTNPNDGDVWIDITCPNYFKIKRWCSTTGVWACENAYNPTIEDCPFEVCEYGIVPSGAVDGINKTFVLPFIPSDILKVSFGGAVRDYTISGNTITLAQAPHDCENVVIDACYNVTTGCPPVYVGYVCETVAVLAGASFIPLSNTPLATQIELTIDPSLRFGETIDYTATAGGINLTTPLAADTTFTACYQF